MALTNSVIHIALPVLPLSEKLPVDRKLQRSPIQNKEEERRFWKRKIELTSIPDYPTPDIFAELASAVYNDCEKDMSLPTGWNLLQTANNAHHTNGYFGAAFWHPENHQVIIAHRGAKLPVIGTVVADIKGTVFNNYVAQMSSAITFADRVVLFISTLNEEKDFQLFFTGHSLGGWLAQITTLTTEYMSLVDEFFQKTKDPKPSQYHAHTVVFDSPGCKPMLSQIISDADLRYSDGSIELGSLDITSYVSAPNKMNTCNAHVGKIYRISTDLSNISWFEKKTTKYNLTVHSIDKIRDELIRCNKSGRLRQEEIEDWPISGTFSREEEYKSLFEFADHSNSYLPKSLKKELLIKTESGYKKIRYQTKPVDEKSCALNVFTANERLFLEQYRWLRHFLKSLKLQKLFNQSDTNSRKRLKDYDTIDNSVRCSTAEKLKKFIPYVKVLLRLFPDIPTKTTKILSSDEIIKKIYERETKFHVNQANEMSLDPETDNIGLKNFLNHKNQNILFQTGHKGTSFPLKWTYKVFNKIKGLTPFVNEDQCTILTLKRLWAIHQTKANVQRILKSFPHVLIIEFNVLLDSDKRLLENFLTTVQQTQDIKLILFAQDHAETEEWIKHKIASTENYLSRDFPRVHLKDLAKDSQKTLSKIKVQIQGKRIALNTLLKVEQLHQFDIQALMSFADTTNSSLVVGLLRRNDLFAAYMKRMVYIEATTLLSLLVSAKPNKTIFLISGLHSATPEQLMKSLAVSFTREEKIILRDRVIVDKNIIIIRSNISEQQFKRFCHKHYTKKIHWLSVTSKEWLWQWYYDPEFYVERTLKIVAVNSVIRQRLLSDCLEQFIFCGLPSEESLWKLLDITEVKEQEQIKQSSKVFFEQTRECANDKFEDLVKKSSNSISLLAVNNKCFTEQLLWERVHPNQSVTVFDNFTLLHNEPLIIITDEPGMGKSSTLMRIAEQRQSRAWIIHLALKDCRNQMIQLPLECPSFPEVTDFLWSAAKSSKDPIAKSIFYNHLATAKDTRFPLLILLDGFDEISQGEQQKIEALLRVLRDAICNSKHQVIVTTRRHPELEKHLGLPFTLQFDGFTRPQQIQFIQHFWRKSCKLLLNAETAQQFDKKSEVFIDALLKQADNILGVETAPFISIPLQLRLLTENFQDKFLLCLATNIEHLPSIETLEMAALYQRFIEVKYQLYFKEKSILQKVLSPGLEIWTRRTLEKCHRQLAVKFLFFEETFVPKAIPTFWETKKITDAEVIEIYQVGLGQKAYGESNFRFIHPTFAEYFVADFLYDHLLKDPDNPKIVLVKNFLFEHILRDTKYRVIRLFLNDRLGNINSERQLIPLGSCIAELYLDDKLQDEKTGNTLLHQACKENHLEIVLFLLRALANKQEVLNCFINLKEVPFDNGSALKYTSVQPTKRTPLHYAATFSCIKIIQALLENGADVEAVDLNGRTPLISAVEQGNESVVMVLLDKGANVNAKNNDGWTVLHLAVRINNESLVKTLLEKGAGVDAVSEYGRTPLINASEAGIESVVKVLLNKGANVNAREDGGWTALHFAVRNSNESLVKTLLEDGADVDAIDEDGRTPLILAVEKGHESVVKILSDKVCNVNA